MKLTKSTILSGLCSLGLLGPQGSNIAIAEEVPQLMDEVVVTATRSEAKTFDVAVPVSVVTEERLEQLSPANVADALDSVPGVSMETAGGWESNPVIRGLGSNRVLVLHDGDRETNLWSGRAPLTPFIDVGSISRIEVVKGPASALYGTDALGGVVNIITKDVEFADGESWQYENRVSTRYSSVDEGLFGRYELAAGGNGLGFRIGISGRDVDSYEDGNGETVNHTQFENTNVDFKSLYKFTDTQKVTAAIRVNSIDDMGVPQKDPSAPYSHFTQFDTYSYKLGYEGQKMGVFDDVQAKLYYVDQERTFEGNLPSSKSPTYNLKTNNIETSATGASMQMTATPNDSHLLISGFEFVREDTDSQESQLSQRNSNDSLARMLTFQPVPDANRMHLGMFAQDEIFFGDRLTVTAGGRYDYLTADAEDVLFTDEKFNGSGKLTSSTSEVNHFSDETDGAATFNLGLLYAVSDALHLTATAGSGFRAPDIFERFSTRGSGSRLIIGDPDLDPEYSYNLDVGMKARFKRFQGEVDGFYNRVNDYIDTVLQTDSFASDISTYKYVNVSDAELYGMDASGQFTLIKGLNLFGTIAYVVGEDRDSGDSLNNIPPLNGTLGARWQAPLYDNASYWIELEGEFFDTQDDPAPGEEETPGYGTANFRAGLKWPSLAMFHDVVLTFNIENMFDKYYISHLRKDDKDFIAEPGRNITVSLAFSF